LDRADYHPALVAEANDWRQPENLRQVCRGERLQVGPASRSLSLHGNPASLPRFGLDRSVSNISNRKLALPAFRLSCSAPGAVWFGGFFTWSGMREPLAGTMAFSPAASTPSGRIACGCASRSAEFRRAVYGTRLWGLPIPRAFHTLTGVLPKVIATHLFAPRKPRHLAGEIHLLWFSGERGRRLYLLCREAPGGNALINSERTYAGSFARGTLCAVCCPITGLFISVCDPLKQPQIPDR